MEETEYTDAMDETEDLFNPYNVDEDSYIEDSPTNDIAEFVETDEFKDEIAPFTVKRVDNAHADVYDESAQKIVSVSMSADKNFTVYEKSGTPAFEYDTAGDEKDTVISQLSKLVADAAELDDNADAEEITDFIPEGGEEVLTEAARSLEKTLTKLNEVLNFNKMGLGAGATKEQADEMFREKMDYAAKLWKETKKKMDTILV